MLFTIRSYLRKSSVTENSVDMSSPERNVINTADLIQWQWNNRNYENDEFDRRNY